MVRSFHRLRSVVGVLILVTVAAGVVMAAPILPRKPQLPDEVRCLTGLKRVSIAIDPLPQELVAAKVGADRLQAVLREELVRAGFEVVDENITPRLIVQCFTVVDPANPETIGVTTLLGVNQEVLLKRLDQEMTLPVATVVTTAMGKRSDLPRVAESEVRRVVSMLETFVARTR